MHWKHAIVYIRYANHFISSACLSGHKTNLHGLKVSFIQEFNNSVGAIWIIHHERGEHTHKLLTIYDLWGEMG